MTNKKILAENAEREKRYRKKIELAEERLNDVSALIPEFNDKFKIYYFYHYRKLWQDQSVNWVEA